MMIRDYHFTKGFFGTNGVSKTAGFTTPDVNEAEVKRVALEHCRTAYVVCDHSKFKTVSSVTFAPFRSGIILTDETAEEFKDSSNIILC
jgi:DeoR family fructose operon transcriptional repressor